MRRLLAHAFCCLSLACMAKEAVVFVGAHPDDSEGFAATAFLLKDRYDIHVVDLTRGVPPLPSACQSRPPERSSASAVRRSRTVLVLMAWSTA